jgi:DNA recombination protein RmuC
MEIMAIVISVLTLLALGLVVFKLTTLNTAGGNDKATDMIQKQMEEIRGQISNLYPALTTTLQNVDTNVNTRLDNAAKAIKDVYGRLGEVQESTKKVTELAQSISSLEEIMKAPKLRGGMGELFLSDLLAQILPAPYFELQYRFKSRETVDAIIRLKDLIIPIDSKFPLENFKRIVEAESESEKIAAKKTFIKDVKKHIDAIRSKYILPAEGTSDFALMYIPAENVYYEIIIKDDHIDDDKSVFKYALDNKIYPVSPNSFYGYLQTILFGLKGMQIEEHARDILKKMSQLAGDYARVGEDFEKMRTHLKNLSASFEATDKRLLKFGDKLNELEVHSDTPLLPGT